MDSAWFAPAVKVPGENRARPLFIERSLPGSIIVNQAAHRYMNEAADYHEVGSSMIQNDVHGAGTTPSFILFHRSEESRVGQEGVRQCRSRGSQLHKKKK